MELVQRKIPFRRVPYPKNLSIDLIHNKPSAKLLTFAPTRVLKNSVFAL